MSRYRKAVDRLLTHLDSQSAAIESAADLVIAALRNRGAVFCAEIGHGIQGDFMNRAGGLAAVQPFSFGLSLTDPVPATLADRPRAEAADREIETVRLAVRIGNLRAGDVMLVGSVSGRNVRPVELALACRGIGVRTVGLTSLAYTARVDPLHPSGKRLSEAVDVVVDIGAPYGDAAIEVPGVDISVMPVSGVGFAVAGWMIWERVIARMAAEGDAPTVFMSVNREGGQAFYESARKRFAERGY